MKLGIGIMSFDRPDYLREALHGLMTNDLTGCDVWLFQDGATCHVTGEARAEQADLDASVRAFEECGFERVVRHDHNISIALNRLSVLEQMSERYEGFIQLEDDVVMARNCVRVMRHLLAQFAGADDMGLIASPLAVSEEERDPNWLYPGPVISSCFATRREWFAPVLARYRQYCAVIGDRPYTPHEAYREEVGALIGTDLPCSSDGGLWWAAEGCGRCFWSMGAPRTRSIGVEGLHSRPEIYAKHCLGDVVLRDYVGETEEPWGRAE